MFTTEEEYIQLVYEMEREIDEDEVENRFQEAIRRANEKCRRKYSVSQQSKRRNHRKRRVHLKFDL
jgi:hypothetical protein